MKEAIWNLLDSPIIFWVCMFEAVCSMTSYMTALRFMVEKEMMAFLGAFTGATVLVALKVLLDILLYGIVHNYIGKSSACLIVAILIAKTLNLVVDKTLMKR